MSGLVKSVKKHVKATCLVEEGATTLQAKKVKASLRGAPAPKLVVNFDAQGSPLGKNATRPDFLYVSDQSGGSNGEVANLGLLVPIEMSSGRSKEGVKITRQLQAGIDWLEPKLDDRHKPRLVPVYCGNRKGSLSRQLKRGECRVSFRGQNVLPRLIEDGERLTNAFRQEGGGQRKGGGQQKRGGQQNKRRKRTP